MTLPFFAGRTTLHRLHRLARRNIERNHNAAAARRHESTKPSSSPTSSPPPIQQRTIPAAWGWIDPLLTPLRGYSAMQKRSPLMTQFESTLVIWYLGDLSAQTVQTNGFADGRQYEPVRGLRAMLIGATTAIPGYKWFLFLGRHFNYPSSHLRSLAVKIAVNQCVFTPVFNAYFFAMQTLLAGGSWREARERVVNTVPVSWVNSLKLWPAVTAINFTFVPWQHRNVFAGCVAIGWQTYLSWLNRQEEQRAGEEREAVERRRAEEDEVVEEKPVKKKRRKKVKKVVEEQEQET